MKNGSIGGEMPYYDFFKEGKNFTFEKLLENYKFLEYITHRKWKENPSVELYMERTQYRKIINSLTSTLKKIKREKNDKDTV